MRHLITSLLLLLSIQSHAQKDWQLALYGSYQFHDRQALSFGVGFSKKLTWPKLKFEHYTEGSLRTFLFLNAKEEDKIYGLRYTAYWTSKYAGIGLDGRLIRQADLRRLDMGPALKIGYKYIWLEYSACILIADNLFNTDADLPAIAFDRVEHTINVTLSVPIITRKE